MSADTDVRALAREVLRLDKEARPSPGEYAQHLMERVAPLRQQMGIAAPALARAVLAGDARLPALARRWEAGIATAEEYLRQRGRGADDGDARALATLRECCADLRRALAGEPADAAPADFDALMERLKTDRLASLQRCRIAKALGLLGPEWNSEPRILGEIRRLRALDAASKQKETTIDTTTKTLKCYRIDDGGAVAHMAAQHAGEALNIYCELQGGDCDSDEFEVKLIPDEKVPHGKKIHDSEDAECPEGYTIREALEKARRDSTAQLLCSTEF